MNFYCNDCPLLDSLIMAYGPSERIAKLLFLCYQNNFNESNFQLYSVKEKI